MRYLVTVTFPIETAHNQPAIPDQIASGVETAISGAMSNYIRPMVWHTPSGTTFQFGNNTQVTKVERVTPDERR